MGKGDQRTKRGKLYRGTHGKARSKKEVTQAKPESKPVHRPQPERPQAERPQPPRPQPEQPS